MEEQPHSEAHREPSCEAGREGHREPHSDEARWMTFQELAAIRGTSKRAAITLIRRHGWRRQRDNQNRVIALVPLTWSTPEDVGEAQETPHSDAHREAHNRPAGQSHAAAFETALAAIEAAHARELATLREQVASAEQARLSLQAMVEQFAGQLRDADQITKAERAASQDAIAAERQRADDLRAQIDELNAEMVVMRAEADRALSQEQVRADRLSAQVEAGHRDIDAARAEANAVRGQVEVAERGAAAADTDRRVAQARLEHAEAAREEERTRADALRDRLTTMQEQLADAHAALQTAERTDARAVRAEQDKERAEASRDTERQRADRTEQGREADRARADVLQAKLNDTQMQLTAHQEVIDAAEAIRKADDARLAWGRWARLRAAWRGI